MASPNLDKLDFITSSVGMKRGFDQVSAEADDDGAKADNLPLGESEHLEKRTRHGSGFYSESGSKFSASNDEDDLNGGEISDPVVPLKDEPIMHSSEIAPTNDRSKVTGAIPPPISWNKGTPGELRTSFGNHASQKTLRLFRPLSSSDQTKEAIKPLESNLEPRREPAPIQVCVPEVGLTTDHPDVSSAASSVLVEEKPTKSKNQKKARQKKKPKRSMFGPPSMQSIVDKILADLPEPTRMMMPMKVPDKDLDLEIEGRIYKLPQARREDKSRCPLSEIIFRGSSSGFLERFLLVNEPMLNFIDFELVMAAFRAYLKCFYGHLPAKLLAMVIDHGRLQTKKAILGCTKTIDLAKKGRQKELGKVIEDSSLNAPGHKVLEALSRISDQGNDPDRQPDKPVDHTKGLLTGFKRTQSQSSSGAATTKGGGGLERPVGYSTSDPATGFKGSDSASVFPVDKARNTAPSIVTDGPVTSTLTILAELSVQMPDSATDGSDINTLEAGSLKKYYPGNGEPLFFIQCLTCAQKSHRTRDCPLLTCASCGLIDTHFIEACPKRQRCIKCRERGHSRSQCPEKLAATSSEGLTCDVCDSTHHLETDCHFLWRSFKTIPQSHRKLVSHIPVTCYCCGADGHYGPECGIRRSPLYTEGYTWSKANWKQYVDSSSQNRAISAGKDYSLPSKTTHKKTFAIKGKAQAGPSAPEDDDDVQFLGSRVTKTPRPMPRGNLKIKFDQSSGNFDSYDPSYHYEPPLPNPRSPRDIRPPAMSDDRRGDRHELSYRPRDDSARHLRERSFSPPPRFPGDHYQPRYGDNYCLENNYRPGENVPAYRPYDDLYGGGKRDRGRTQGGRDDRNTLESRIREPKDTTRHTSYKHRRSGKRGGVT